MHVPGTDLSQRDKLMNMDLEKFRRSLNDRNPPAGLTLPLTALWWDANENWAKAHDAAQRDEGPQGSWVHAYLHRKEPCTDPDLDLFLRSRLSPLFACKVTNASDRTTKATRCKRIRLLLKVPSACMQ
jgi:hypothetical protein